MGAKGKNFYYDLATRFGFGAAADTIQELYLQGRKGEAMMAVPDALVDAVALVGSKARIRDRLQLWRDCPITTLNITTFSVEASSTNKSAYGRRSSDALVDSLRRTSRSDLIGFAPYTSCPWYATVAAFVIPAARVSVFGGNSCVVCG